MNDMRCDSGHLCVVCWAEERRYAIHRWLFRRLPVRWRHRIVMREAMRRRRVWRELQREGATLALLVDPRGAHLNRRLLRNLLGYTGLSDFPRCRIEWREDSE